MIEFLLVSKKSGIPILLRNYTTRELNHNILSGLFQTIDFLSKTEMNSELQQIQLKDGRYITFRKEVLADGIEISFLLVSQHCLGFERQEDCICVPSTLNSIATEFTVRYKDFDFNTIFNTKHFSSFEDYIDRVFEKHFHSHFCNRDFFSFKTIKEKVSTSLLGYVLFKEGKLENYSLQPEISNLRYQSLMKLVIEWEKLQKNPKLKIQRQTSEFELFKSVLSTIENENSDIVHMFTFWKADIKNDLMYKLHDGLIERIDSEN
ncbi:MAG: hypothetical protein ACXAEU_23985 [Candidatus Hodarchaeales archaeon]|jgi:hypothetical protein